MLNRCAYVLLEKFSFDTWYQFRGIFYPENVQVFPAVSRDNTPSCRNVP